MRIYGLFDPLTFTLTYVVYDPDSHDAVIIDPVLDFDPLTVRTSLASIEKLGGFVREQGLSVRQILETHAHADHLSGAQHLKRTYGVGVAIGARITEVQQVFQKIFDLPARFATDGSQFDRLLGDGEGLHAGTLSVTAMATPGHTPACVTYKIGDALFTGDTLFMEDYGTGRCDFPRGSAEDLYDSVHDKLYRQPDETRVFVGHDYLPGGRELRFETTIGVSKRHNIQLREETTKQEYVAFRRARDKTLAPPRLLFPSVQINIDAGRLPPPHENGVRYLHIPFNLGQPTDDDGAAPQTPQS